MRLSVLIVICLDLILASCTYELNSTYVYRNIPKELGKNTNEPEFESLLQVNLKDSTFLLTLFNFQPDTICGSFKRCKNDLFLQSRYRQYREVGQTSKSDSIFITLFCDNFMNRLSNYPVSINEKDFISDKSGQVSVFVGNRSTYEFNVSGPLLIDAILHIKNPSGKHIEISMDYTDASTRKEYLFTIRRHKLISSDGLKYQAID